jgi:NitT/TauT family transport system ATP-binding protein
MQILSLNKVSLTYFSDKEETLALKDISFSVEKGEFVSIVGPSGCGKTTILSLISGLIKATSGTIEIKNDEKSNFVGYMFQRDNLLEWRTVLGNVYLGLELRKMKTKENIEYVNSLLKKYNLWDFKDKYPRQLSGGMRQRVALIRTLALNPSVLLLDEAFSALDYQTRLDVCDDVYKIIKSENLTTILVTHDISEAISMSDKIIILSNRPAVVKDIMPINIPDSNTPFKRRESIKAKEYFDMIWRELK